MLGHRGCRLCITYPEILEMQVRAIIEAAIECQKGRVKVLPEIMIPLTLDKKELAILVDADPRGRGRDLLKKAGVKLPLPGGHDDRAAACGVAWRTRSPKWRSSSPSAPTT